MHALCGRSVADDGACTCTECGYILKDTILAEELETRQFDEDGSTSRAGAATSNQGEAACTESGSKSVRGPLLGRRLSPRQQSAKGIAATLRARLRVSPLVLDDSEAVFAALEAAGRCKRRKIGAVVGACFRAALKRHHVDRSFEDIVGAGASDSGKDTVKAQDLRDCWKDVSEVAKTVFLASSASAATNNNDGVQFLARWSAQLRLPTTVDTAASLIARRIKENTPSSCSPATIASTALFFACRLHPDEPIRSITLTEVSTVASIGEVSIKRCCKAVHPHLAALVTGIDYITTDVVAAFSLP
jgi:transcription initiation factor TFIIIB Brf1 subunit/transcription initiation factor TFIIB